MWGWVRPMWRSYVPKHGSCCHISHSQVCYMEICGAGKRDFQAWIVGNWFLWFLIQPRITLPEHRSILTTGFVQIWQMMKKINGHYGWGLRWFLLAVVFANVGANAFTVVSVPFLSVLIQMDGAKVWYLFLIVLVLSILGTKLGEMVIWTVPILICHWSFLWLTSWCEQC